MRIKSIIGLGSAFAGATSLVYFGKTLYSADELAKKIELQEDDKPVPVPKKVNDLILEVMHEMNLPDDAIQLIKSVAVDGVDLEHFGSSRCKPGAYLMIPRNYFVTSEKTSDVNFVSIFKSLQLAQDSQDMDELKPLLIMPEKAQKFILANEIFKTRDYFYYALGSLPLVSIALVALILYNMNKLNLKFVKNQPKLIISGSIFCYMLFYFILYRYVHGMRVEKADEKTASLGRDYIEGALEYFDRIIDRNKMVKRLNNRCYLNDNPDKVPLFSFTEFVPISERINFFKSKILGLESGKTQSGGKKA